jgi:hypothetical protein
LSAGNRKAAKRTFPFALKAGETIIQLTLPQPPQAEDDGIPERKRPRPGEPLPTPTDEANTEDVSHAASLALPPPDTPADATSTPDPPPEVDAAALDADSDLVMDTHPNVSRTRMKYCWTCGEDADLIRAFTNTHNNKWGKINWDAVTAQVPGRTRDQCRKRWYHKMNTNTNIYATTSRTGKWTADEDKQLKNTVPTEGVKNRFFIAVCWSNEDTV